MTKYEVRKQISKEFDCARGSFYAELMDNPTDKLFYKLIRNNQSSASKVAHSMLMTGLELKDRRSQCGTFASYNEDLAAPNNHPNFSQECLNSATLQKAVIEEITRLKPDELILIDEEDVFQAITSLNSGKAADELELTAEHLKYSDRVALPIIIEIFKEILRTKKVPEQFKSGIINPIHKMVKIPGILKIIGVSHFIHSWQTPGVCDPEMTAPA